ncbi:TenA family transcriptional regulator [Pseudomonas neuropathica]
MKNDSNFNSESVAGVTQVIPGGILWNKWLDSDVLHRLVNHDLLVAMRSGHVSREGMRYFLVQHHYYSRNFTRFLCAIINRLESLGDIKLLMQNMQEEMGIDSEGKVTHAELFQRSLRSLGADVMAEPPLAQTADFNAFIMKCCRSENAVEGLAALCLGAEAIVPLIYKPILVALKGLNVGEEGLEFFRLHIEEDEEHAVTLLGILDRLTGRDPETKALAIQTGFQAINKRCDMFDAVWREIRRYS